MQFCVFVSQQYMYGVLKAYSTPVHVHLSCTSFCQCILVGCLCDAVHACMRLWMLKRNIYFQSPHVSPVSNKTDLKFIQNKIILDLCASCSNINSFHQIITTLSYFVSIASIVEFPRSLRYKYRCFFFFFFWYLRFSFYF